MVVSEGHGCGSRIRSGWHWFLYSSYYRSYMCGSDTCSLLPCYDGTVRYDTIRYGTVGVVA
jgi:hypothetical protein